MLLNVVLSKLYCNNIIIISQFPMLECRGVCFNPSQGARVFSVSVSVNMKHISSQVVFSRVSGSHPAMPTTVKERNKQKKLGIIAYLDS